MSPFPFLLPLKGVVALHTKTETGLVYAVLKDRRLVQFRDERSGGRLLTKELPGGQTIWMDCVESTVHVVKRQGHQGPVLLFSFPLPDGPLRATHLVSGANVRAVHGCGEVILLLRDPDVRAHALNDGRPLGRAVNPHQWLNGRFFRGQTGFYFAAWDGQNVKFEPVTLPSSIVFNDIVTIFDRQGMEGPWLLSRSGELIVPVTGERTPLNYAMDVDLDFSLVRVYQSGHRLFVPQTNNPDEGRRDGYYFNLSAGASHHLHWSPNEAPFDQPATPTWHLHYFFEAIAATPDGLAMRGRNNGWQKINLSPLGTLVIRDLPAREIGEPSMPIEFASEARPTHRGGRLRISHPGRRRTWVNDFEDWANRQLRRLNEQGERIRNREIHRLLHLFDTDPEAALRHAIPMNAFPHRGLAPPGTGLGSRLPNFDLSRLGGRAADFWNVPPNVQNLLRLRYREMADREMQLGRHRRAAYIYAELLGDLVSAANALKQGKHFREAALLYEEHLKIRCKPPAAWPTEASSPKR